MTMVSRTLVGAGPSKVLVLHRTISAADETNTVIYDNSAFVNDVSKGNLMRCIISGSDALINLAWDQTTDSPVLSANPATSPKFNFFDFGGIPNPNATGATGDLLVTTSGVAAGESVTIILWILQN